MSAALHLLGTPEIEVDGERSAPRLGKPFCLLAYLAYADEWVGRDRLALLFWPESDESSAKAALRQLLRRARALPFAAGLEVEPERLRWRVATDASAFRSALAQGAWDEALALWRGPLLDGLPAMGGGVDAWLELERDGLAEARRSAALAHADALEGAGRNGEAAAALRELLHDDDLAEDVLQRYLRAAYLAGQRDAALAAFEGFATRLREELELEPLGATAELVALIRDAAPLEGRNTPLPGGAPAAPPEPPLQVLRPPRTVGRERTLAAIRAASAPLVVIAGEAGIGKTRLLHDLAEAAPALRCREGLERVPYHPLTALLRERLARGAPTPPLGGYLDDLARLVPDLAPDRRPGPGDPEVTRSRLLEGVARYLEGIAPAGAAWALRIDDLQWADEATVTLLLFLAERGTLPVIATRRSYETPPELERALRAAAARGALAEVALEPLGAAEVRELLASLMGRDEGPPVFAAWLHRTSGGNPMFALETLRALFASGRLEQRAPAGGDGPREWSTHLDDITRDYSELEMPGAVAEVIARRLGALRPETLRVLRSAAVIGDADPDALARVAGLSPLAVLDALEDGERNGILAARDFAHDLLRQGLEATLSAERRRLLHARAADALEGLRDDAVIAEHRWRAGQRGAALAAWLRAGRSLRGRGLIYEAAAQLERALELTAPAGSGSGDDEPDEDAASRWALVAELAQVRKRTADFDGSERLVTELLASCDDPAPRAFALLVHCDNLLHRGRIDEALGALERAEAQGATDPELQHDLAVQRAIVTHYRGDSADAVARFRALVARERAAGPSPTLSQLISNLAAALDHTGDHAAALPLHREALALAERLGARNLQVDAALNLLYCAMDLGRTEEALSAAEAALELDRYEGSEALRANVAAAHRKLGRWDEAARHYRLLTEESGDPTVLAIAWANLAHHAATSGAAAEASAEDALERALDWGERTDFAMARARVAISALRHGGDAHAARARALLADVERDALPEYARSELEVVLNGDPERTAGIGPEPG